MAKGSYLPDDYVPVAERLEKFHVEHPTGRVMTSLQKMSEGIVIFGAELFPDGEPETMPMATGNAMGELSGGEKTVEKTETVAIGRALANAGYAPTSEQRMSREEADAFHQGQDRQHQRAEPQRPADAQPPSTRQKNDFVTTPLTFGKHKGKTWAQLVAIEPEYIEWAIEAMDKLGEGQRRTLLELLERQSADMVQAEAEQPTSDGPRRPLSEPEDDLPF